MSILGGLLYQPETSTTVITEIVSKTTTNVLMSSSSSSSQSNVAGNVIEVANIKAGEGCSLDISTNQKIIQTPNFSSTSEIDQSSNLSTAVKDAI